MSFSKRLIEATVVPDNVFLTMEDQDVEFDLQFDGDAALTLIPKSRFTPNATYTIELRNNLMSEEGDTLETIRWKFTTAPNLGATPQDVIDSCMTKVDIDMLAAVNEARAKGHSCISGDFPPAEPLKWSCALGAAAYRHSADMATNNFLQHTGSDGSSHSDRLERAGYKAVRSAENIAGGFQDVKRVVADWLQSDMGHCENIMNPLYEDFGSALVTASPTMVKFGRYWTQSFGQHEAPEEDEPEAQP